MVLDIQYHKSKTVSQEKNKQKKKQLSGAQRLNPAAQLDLTSNQHTTGCNKYIALNSA